MQVRVAGEERAGIEEGRELGVQYSVPDVPRSHWIGQGHDEDYAEETKNLIRSIKDNTSDLRSGDGDIVAVGCDIAILSDNALNL